MQLRVFGVVGSTTDVYAVLRCGGIHETYLDGPGQFTIHVGKAVM